MEHWYLVKNDCFREEASHWGHQGSVRSNCNVTPKYVTKMNPIKDKDFQVVLAICYSNFSCQNTKLRDNCRRAREICTYMYSVLGCSVLRKEGQSREKEAKYAKPWMNIKVPLQLPFTHSGWIWCLMTSQIVCWYLMRGIICDWGFGHPLFFGFV